ncbi:MAG TPA: FAD-dependent oxidoreductase [Tepidisphaeraceae bacterium]|nr:FAD-dependent oxidoreductase [Tepidisphaeraceae bacterium]
MNPRSTARRIAIVGAGPIGLEAAAYARALGHDVIVLEQRDVADAVRSWGFVAMFSPWGMNTTPLGWRAIGRGMPDQKICPTGNELRETYLLPLAATLSDSIRTGSQGVAIGRDDFAKGDAIGKADRAASPFRILVRDSGAGGAERVERADVVLDCSGTYGHHRWAGRGGIPAPGERAAEPRVWYRLPDVLGADREHFAGRHTLLLGAGYSAATVLHGLGRLHREDPRTRVSWAIRRVGQALEAIHDDSLPARASLVKGSLELANHPPEWLQYLGNCTLERIDAGAQFGVTLRYVETDMALVVDEVVALVGYAPDASIYEQLQVHQCYATAGPMKLATALMAGASGGGDCLAAGAAIGPEALRNPEPGFFILGAKSFGTRSNFLLQVGHQQVRDAFRILHDDAELDLYRTA